MRIALHPCYVLHQRPYRETSLTLEVLSRDYGRVPLIAKGARRARGPQRYVLQPLRRLSIAWILRGELGTLTQAEASGAPPALTVDGLMSAFYVNELMLRLLHRHEPHPELFAAYETVLAALADAAPPEAALRVFEKHLLLGLGYGLVLDRDVQSGVALDRNAEYFYDLDYGPTHSPRAGARTVPVSGAALVALATGRFDDARSLDDAKRLMRAMLAEHLGAKPLSSRELYRSFLRERERA